MVPFITTRVGAVRAPEIDLGQPQMESQPWKPD